MAEIVFSPHSLEQLADRGATEAEVVSAIGEGEQAPAKLGRLAFRKNFPFQADWKGRYYETKQVLVIVKQDVDVTIVVTVYVFYFGGKA